MQQSTSWRLLSDWPLLIVGLLMILLVALNIQHKWTSAIDLAFYDQQLRWLPQTVDDDIVLIEIDEQSISLIGPWPWDRSFHAELMNELRAVDVLAYNVFFENSATASDPILIKAIEEHGQVILPMYFDQAIGNSGLRAVLPDSNISKYATIGHVNTYLDADGVYRRVRLIDHINQTSWVHYSLAATALIDHSFSTIDADYSNALIPFKTQKQPFTRYSFVDVLTGQVDITLFEGKQVFVGVTATSIGDPLIIPTSKENSQTSAVKINADIFSAIKSGNLIHPVHPLWAYLLNLCLVAISLMVVPRLSGWNQAGFSLVTLAVALLTSYVLLSNGKYFPVAGSTLAILAIPFIWNVLRLNRLFMYLRAELIELRSQQQQERFLNPSKAKLHSAIELEAVMAILEISEYQLHEVVGSTVLHPSSFDMSGENVSCQIVFDLENKKLQLNIQFKELTQLERRKVKLLEQLLVPSSDSHTIEGSDVFSRQLSMVQNFQQQLRSAHVLFEASIESIASGIMVMDLSGRVLFSNNALNSMMEKPPLHLSEALQGLQIASGPSWQSYIRNAVVKQQEQVFEAKRLGRDLAISVQCVDNEETESSLLVVNVGDITNIKAAQRSRIETIDFLSHDLRSPMASLQALVQQVKASPDTSSIQEVIDKVDLYSRRSLDFAEQFLNLAKVENEEQVQLYDVDLYTVCQNAIDSLYHQTLAKELVLNLSVCDDAWVNANGDLLERVMLNLISNAIKYSPKHTQIDVIVTLAENDGSNQLLIEVIDQGDGIAKEQQANLFKPFVRGEGGNEQRAKGLGLGLRFVDIALKRHASQINLLSPVKEGIEGSCFYFYLPALS